MRDLEIQIIFITIVQLGIISVLIFNSNQIKSRIFIFLLIELFFIQTLMKVINKYWLMESLHRYYYIGYDLPFLFGPLLLLFAKSKTGNPISRKDLYLFVPFLMGATVSLTREWIQNSIRESNYMIIFAVLGILQLSLLIFCSRNSWQYFRSAEKDLKSTYSLRRKTIYSWGKRLVLSVTMLGGFLIIYLRVAYITFSFLYLPLLYMPFFLALIGVSFFAMWEPEIEETDNAMFKDSNQKYSKSKLTDPEAVGIIKQLQNLMIEKHIFLDPELRIDQLADCIGVSKHKLSQAINTMLNKTFYDFINEARIKEAKKLLSKPEMNKYTLSTIAAYSGFNSYTTFNLVFKKLVKMTPYVYKKQILNGKKNGLSTIG